MDKRIPLVFLLVCLMALAFASRVSALSTVVSDSFEDGDWTVNPQWVETNDAGIFSVQTSVVAEGDRALRGHNLGAPGNWVSLRTANFTAQNVPWSISFYWRYDQVGAFSAHPDDIWCIAYWFATSPSDPGTDGIIMHHDGRIGLDNTLPDTGATGEVLFANTLASGNWHFIELYVNVTAGYLWLNETYVGTHPMGAAINNVIGVTNVWPASGDGWVAYWDRIVLADEIQGYPPPPSVTFYYHTGIDSLAVNGAGLPNATTRVYASGTDVTLLSTEAEDYSFWRYLIAGSYHVINPYTHEVTATTTAHSYATSGTGGATGQAMNWWLMLTGFIFFVSPPFLIAKRRYGEAANVIILLFVMVIGLALIGAGVS